MSWRGSSSSYLRKGCRVLKKKGGKKRWNEEAANREKLESEGLREKQLLDLRKISMVRELNEILDRN
jgi:hypothetical protein